MSEHNRLYYPVWNKLKCLPLKEAQTIGVSIAAPQKLHKRIIKAVRKEKWMDVGWKVEIEPRTAELVYIRDNSIVTFFLKYTIIAEDL